MTNNGKYFFIFHHFLKISFTFYRIKLIILMNKSNLSAINTTLIIDHLKIAFNTSNKWNAYWCISTRYSCCIANFNLCICNPLNSIINLCFRLTLSLTRC